MIRLNIKYLFLLLPVTFLAGCAAVNPPKDTRVINNINEELKAASKNTIIADKSKVPGEVSSALLPPLKMPMPKSSARQLDQRFDLVVSDAPVNQVFMGIVTGTRFSMLVHPEVKGTISMNLKDVTLYEALQAIRELYGYEYKVEGNRIYVLRPGLQAKLYKVNYIVGLRRGRSDITVTSGASGESGANSNSNSNTSSRGSSQSQASSVASSQRTDFWTEIEDGVRTVLGCKIPNQTTTSTSTTGGNFAGNNSVTRQTQTMDPQFGPRERGGDGCSDGRSVLVNPMSGAIFVRAQPEELRAVESMLQAMQVSIDRQVILEAKIIDVELNSGAQQGINWAAFQNGLHRASVGADISRINETNGNGGTIVSESTVGDVLGTGLVTDRASAFQSGLGVALQIKNFSALLNFLQTQGNVNVLSSPRISTINNQKAVLKVGRDEQFVTGFESNSNTTATTGGTINNQPTPIYSTFFSGISLDVTPQIDEEGNITLHVHPLVSEVTEVEKKTINNLTLPFASNKISETDSVVKVRDGQIVVIGGLMTDKSVDNRGKVTGVGNIPVIGALFRNGAQSSSKRELVIMLKPTVVKGNEAWTDDLAKVQQRIENLGASPEPTGDQ